MNISRIPSPSINSELERLFSMQTNDEKVGEIKLFLRDEKTKKANWSKDEYYRLLRLLGSCESQFCSRDGRIENKIIAQLMDAIPSIKAFKVQETQGRAREKAQRILRA
jgi:hypothetical protein